MRLAFGIALSVTAGCAMSLDGKPVGFGGGSSTASASPTSGSSSDASGASNATAATAPAGEVAGAPSGDGQDTGHYRNYPRYPTAPTDPWLAVQGDQPSRVDDEWRMRASPYDCTARHDHCFDARTWFFESDRIRDRDKYRVAIPGAFGPDGPKRPENLAPTHLIDGGGDYTAYRTVPATRTNLKAGIVVVALAYPNVTPSDGGAAYELTWKIGVVDRVDWDLMTIYLKNYEDESLAIAATRVAVLSWRPGGKVAILGGAARDQIQVSSDAVILPDPAP